MITKNIVNLVDHYYNSWLKIQAKKVEDSCMFYLEYGWVWL